MIRRRRPTGTRGTAGLWVPLALAVLISASACTREPVVLGDPTTAAYAPVSIPQLRMNSVDMLGLPVKLGQKFKKNLIGDFEGGNSAFMADNDFGEMVILYNPQKWGAQVATLKKDRRVILYGYVTTVIPPHGNRSYLAILVD